MTQPDPETLSERFRRITAIACGIVLALAAFFTLCNAMGVLPWQDPVAPPLAATPDKPNTVIGQLATTAQLGIDDGVTSPLYLNPQTGKPREAAGGDAAAGRFRPLLANALLQPENLIHWQLCGDELRSEQSIRTALANGRRLYPHDAPNNRDPNSKTDIDMSANYAADAELFGRAAVIADKAQIACAVAASPGVHWLVFDVQMDSGWERVGYPDEAVLQFGTTAEEVIATNNCVDATTKRREAMANQPLDTVPRSNPLDTFSERRKALHLAQYDALLVLERTMGRLHC